MHITVCICTFKRPIYLRRLLDELAQQDIGGLFTFSIVVVDNDKLRSAEWVVSQFKEVASIPITYAVEPEQNIALARNRALANASGEFAALIDDDEFPEKRWLLTLFKACAQDPVHGVLGPVNPYFEQKPPPWVIKGKFFERPRLDTGCIIDWTEGRTGNLLFKREILNGIGPAFRREFGSGGEDRDFFKRMIGRGHVFVWCNGAVAYEVVPPARWKRSFMLRRALLRGKVSLVDPTSRMLNLIKSVIAIPVYTLALPFLFVFGQHRFMKYLIKTFDHLGRILTFLGIDVVKEKYVTE